MNKVPRLMQGLLILSALAVLAGCQCSQCISKCNIAPSDGLDFSSLQDWAEPHGDWLIAGGVQLNESNSHLFAIDEGEGVLVNGADGRTSNLHTAMAYGDVEAHVEFCVSSNSNSGVYFQGRYEIQILDSWGKTDLNFGDCGGIYARYQDGSSFEGHAPPVNASRPPGEWQTFHIVFRAPRFNAEGNKLENARFIKVVHNGVTLHENVEVHGPTRASTWGDEKHLGPIMLQGDHGPVAYRNIRVRSVNLP